MFSFLELKNVVDATRGTVRYSVITKTRRFMTVCELNDSLCTFEKGVSKFFKV